MGKQNQYTALPWTTDQEEELARLRPTHSVRVLAQHFGKGQRTIEKALKRLGLRLQRNDLILTSAQHALFLEKYPVSGSRDLLHLTPDAAWLHRYAHRHGIRTYSGVWSETEQATLTEYCAKGLSYRAIARLLGRSPGAVFNQAVNVLHLAKVAAPRHKREKKPQVARVKVEKPAKLAKEKPAPKAPKTQVVRDEPDYRSLAKRAACGREKHKVTKKAEEGQQSLARYLRLLPATHEHSRAFERMTRPGQPRRVLKTVPQFLEAAAQAGYLTPKLAA